MTFKGVRRISHCVRKSAPNGRTSTLSCFFAHSFWLFHRKDIETRPGTYILLRRDCALAEFCVHLAAGN